MAWALDPQARTLRAEIDLPNPGGELRPGTYAVVSISVETSEVRAVPAKALVKAGETMAIFVVRDGKAVRVRVKAGRSDGNYTEVAMQQTADGKWEPFAGELDVIANPPANLTDGQTVEVVK
jgi:hypothetical protein